MALKVGELYATLGLDDAGFKSNLVKDSGLLEKLGVDLAGITGPAGIAAAAIVAVASVLISSATAFMHFGSEMIHMSERTNLSTQTLQQLRYVSNVLGSDFEGLTGTVGILQRKLLGIEDDTGTAALVMKQLGIDVSDSNGHLKSMDELFMPLLRKLQEIPNPTERAAMAAQLFGRNYGAIAPLLSMTREEMEKTMAQANIFSNKQLEDAYRQEQIWNSVKERVVGWFRTLGSYVLPFLSKSLAGLEMAGITIGALFKNIWNLLSGKGWDSKWFDKLQGQFKEIISSVEGAEKAQLKMGETGQDATYKVAQGVVDVVVKMKQLHEEERQRQRDLVGWSSASDIWKTGMVAGTRFAFGSTPAKSAIDIPLRENELPNRDILKSIHKTMLDAKEIQARILQSTAKGLGGTYQ